MGPERRVALREHGVVERAQRELPFLRFLVVAPQLQHHQLADRVHEVGRIERAALRFAARGRFFEKRFVPEEAHPLLDRQILAVQADGDDEAGQAHERFGKLAELERGVAAAEAGLHHHVLAVVRPAFDERRGREQRRLADLRLDLPQVLEVEEVARIDLVDRDVPQRRQVEVAHVLLLPLRRPSAIDVGQVVVRAAWLALERARRPHAGKRPAVELGRRRDDDRLGVGQRHDRLPLKKLLELLDLLLRGGDERPGIGMLLLGGAPGRDRIAAVQPAGHDAELLLHLVQLAQARSPAGDRRSA